MGSGVFRERQTLDLGSQKVNKMLTEGIENRLVLVGGFDSRKLKGEVLQVGLGCLKVGDDEKKSCDSLMIVKLWEMSSDLRV